jgi:hypothetical protein
MWETRSFALLLVFFVGSAQALTVTVDNAYRITQANGDEYGEPLQYEEDVTADTGYWSSFSEAITPGNFYGGDDYARGYQTSTIGASGEYDIYNIDFSGGVSTDGDDNLWGRSRLSVTLTFGQDVYYDLTLGDPCNSNYTSISGFGPNACNSDASGRSGFLTAGTYTFHMSIYAYPQLDDGFQYVPGGEQQQVGVVFSTVPVPAAVWLFGSALAGLGWMRRKQTV